MLLKGMIYKQMNILQVEMDRVKEENKVMMKMMEQTLKDYYDLQMKFAATIQENNKKIVNQSDYSFSSMISSSNFHSYIFRFV